MTDTFDRNILEACEREMEIELTTYGRKSGKPRNVIIWISRDGDRLFIRSGGGMARDWPQNLAADERAVVHVAGMEVPVRAIHIEDPAVARQITRAVAHKYKTGADGYDRKPDDPPVPAELATFELVPA